MSGGSDGGGVDLSSEQEGRAVGSELGEEGRQVVDGLEGVNVLGLDEVVVEERGDDEEEEHHEETDSLHADSTVELVVHEQGSEVVSDERDGDVDQVVEPAVHDGRVDGDDDLDERRLEELGAVEEEIGREPASGRTDESTSEVADEELERLDVVSSDGSLLPLLSLELSVHRVVSSVVPVVGEPERHEANDTELDSESPLDREG